MKGHGVFAALDEGKKSTWQLIAPPVETNAVGLNVSAAVAWAAISDPLIRREWDYGFVGVVGSEPDTAGTLFDRKLFMIGTIREQVMICDPPADGGVGQFKSQLASPKGLLKGYSSRFLIHPEKRFCRIEATVTGDISPFLLRRWLGGVLAAWLARSLIRLKENVEQRSTHSL